jgi:microcystin-dependent protein
MYDDDHFVGEIRMFTGDFAPRGWAFCDGSLINDRQNLPLFAILYGLYGSIDEHTIRLPDLRSRVPIHNGLGDGLSITHSTGNAVGTETVSATESIPARFKAQSPTEFKAMPANQSLIQPVFAINFIIALVGCFPQRP